MQLWIDNTGLQSAGLCLDSRAALGHDYDVRGLLQLATLIIYGNKVSLNGFEDSGIAKRTHEFVEQLRAVGVTEDILSISSVEEPEYALACKTSADSIAPGLCEEFKPNEFKLIGGEPPDLPRGLKYRQVKFVELAREREGSTKLQEVEESALLDKAVGAVEYMLACSPALRSAISRLLTMYPNWRESDSYQLNVFLRYHLNDALGEQAFSRYAPAIARAELVARRNQYILESVGDIVDTAVAELRGASLGIPSTLAALLQRSKGEPLSILKAALDFREHSKPLRDSLEKLATKHLEDTPESRFEIQKEMRSLGEQLRRDVGLEKAAKLRDALDIRFVIGIPAPTMSGKEIVKWIKERMQSKRTAVLTELVKASAHADFSTRIYEKLRARSTSKTV